jgi:hypothetical protein
VLQGRAMVAFLTWLLLVAHSRLKSRAKLEGENLVLRQQLIVQSRPKTPDFSHYSDHEPEFRRTRFDAPERFAVGHCTGTNQSARSTRAPKVR